MSGLAVGMMILICSLIWGGFALLLRRALGCEGAKQRDASAAGGEE